MPSVVIYARVSTEDGQDTAAQVRTCQAYAGVHGYTVQLVYEDHASAVNFRGRREWRTMLEDLKRWAPRTRPKGILAYALDRVVRSLIDYVNVTEQLKKLDVALVTADGTLGEIGAEGDPYREAMAGFLAVFAELERKVIVRRTRDGIANAQAKGVKFGAAGRTWPPWPTRRPRGSSSAGRAGRLTGRHGRPCPWAYHRANGRRPWVSLRQRFRLLNDAVPKRGCCPAGLNR